MKKVIVLMALSSLIICLSCEKEDLTDSIDITKKSWSLTKITVNGDKSEVDNSGYFNKDAYNLYFENDSIFQLNTSTNLAKGQYNIDENGLIEIFYYHEFTEVGVQNKIDEKLLEKLLTMNSYRVLGQKLYYNGSDCEMEFSEK